MGNVISYPTEQVGAATVTVSGSEGQTLRYVGAVLTPTSFLYNSGSKIGIGTTTPVSELQVISTSTATTRGIMSTQYSNSTDSARFHMRKGRGTLAAPTTVVTGDMLGRLVASGYDGTNYLEMAAIEMSSTGTIGTTRVPTKMSFWTATDAAPSVLTERMTILPNGNVGIGVLNALSKTHIYDILTIGVAGVVDGQINFPESASIINFDSDNNQANAFIKFRGGVTDILRISKTTVGIGTMNATNLLSFSGQTAFKIWGERNTTANTAGVSMTLEAPGATVGATDKDGGSLILSSAISTGLGKSDVVIKTVTNGATGTTDRTATDKMQVLGRSLVDNTTAGTGYDAGSYIDITPGTSGGMLQLMIGDGQEYVWAIFTSAAVVTLITNSANVVNTNTDAKFCIVDNGSTVRISNALGSTLTMSGTIIYNQ